MCIPGNIRHIAGEEVNIRKYGEFTVKSSQIFYYWKGRVVVVWWTQQSGYWQRPTGRTGQC